MSNVPPRAARRIARAALVQATVAALGLVNAYAGDVDLADPTVLGEVLIAWGVLAIPHTAVALMAPLERWHGPWAIRGIVFSSTLIYFAVTLGLWRWIQPDVFGMLMVLFAAGFVGWLTPISIDLLRRGR